MRASFTNLRVINLKYKYNNNYYSILVNYLLTIEWEGEEDILYLLSKSFSLPIKYFKLI